MIIEVEHLAWNFTSGVYFKLDIFIFDFIFNELTRFAATNFGMSGSYISSPCDLEPLELGAGPSIR